MGLLTAVAANFPLPSRDFTTDESKRGWAHPPHPQFNYGTGPECARLADQRIAPTHFTT